MGRPGPERILVNGRLETDLEQAARALKGRYSSDAEAYQRMWAPELLPLSRRLLPELPLERARRVLDVGAGVGSLLSEIQRAAPGAHVIGVELARGMIARAPEGFGRAVMDAGTLAFMDRVFDVGLMAFMLFHLPQPLDGLEEMRRVLRPGGAIGTLTWGDDPSYPALDIWNEELDAHHAAPADRRLSRHALVDSCEKVAALLERAGFETIRCWTGPYESRIRLRSFSPIARATGPAGCGSTRSPGSSARHVLSVPADGSRSCMTTISSTAPRSSTRSQPLPDSRSGTRPPPSRAGSDAIPFGHGNGRA